MNNRHCSVCLKGITNENSLQINTKQVHVDCFKCYQCKTNLANKQFGEKNEKLYCLGCLVEKCSACRQAVTEGGIIALNKTWHSKCFVCSKCKSPFADGKFVVENEKQVLCSRCSQTSNNNSQKSRKLVKCKHCKQVINENEVRIIALENSYHERCFLCASCQTALNPQKFCSVSKKPHCPDCALLKKAVKCNRCNKLITSTIIFALKKNWHPECLRCHYCNALLTNYGKVYRRGKYPCCPACVESVFNSHHELKNNNNNNNNSKTQNNNNHNTNQQVNKPKINGASLITSLETLLGNEVGIDYFIKFLVREYAVENILFWMDVKQFHDLQNPHDIKIYSKSIFTKYIQNDSELEINIDSDVKQRIIDLVPNPNVSMFDEAFDAVFTLMRDHSFQNFILNSPECKELCSL